MAEHWCQEHKTPFFKKGRMRAYAHPIITDDGEPTGDWCNEEGETKDIPKDVAKSTLVPIQVEVDPDMTRDNWAEKNKVTRKSIERQTSLNAAVKVAEIIGDKEKLTEKIISTAKKFELYLETGIDILVIAQGKEELAKVSKTSVAQTQDTSTAREWRQ